ncbi:MAG TPA: DUF551 domain-containing protein [Gammaproteobacteria bacterium]|nr:DUF551 domain-containing protein [Gammaproteobacteria bacterium]
MSNQKPERWISVKDRLPERYDDVLGFFGNAGCLVASLDEIDDTGGTHWSTGNHVIDAPSHWMPLPASPKADAGGEKV